MGGTKVRRYGVAIASVLLLWHAPAQAAGYTIVGWNNLGMHCMDADFSVLSLLPPYNVIHAQVIDPSGKLVTDPGGEGITVTYHAVADGDGSINSTSQGKTNFWQYVLPLFGASLPVDTGLTGVSMPGPANPPQPMRWDPGSGWFVAEGIPITPYDDSFRKNAYPMMRLEARDETHTVVASTDIVLPVSDEMDCSACHSPSAPSADAMPAGGWKTDADPQREMRLNVVAKHDDLQEGDPDFTSALAAVGYNPAGLYATVTIDGKPILCAACHASEALAAGGQPNVKSLTEAVHGLHATVTDPLTQQSLDSAEDRSACYRCHPGSLTRCLRGVMGASTLPDGSLAIQCQDCHGTMSAVGAAGRLGWLQEPACQSCHTGTATDNNGELRYDSVFDAPGHVREAVNDTFATNADVPAAGLSLYRFSTGHGGVKCEACHGSTHAEFASTHDNDNVQSLERQGHVGVLAECGSCHGGVQPSTVDGGPHGLHPLGQSWVNAHPAAVEAHGSAQCRACHGLDYRGTVLSRAQAARTLSGETGTRQVWRGFQIGCYACHLGPHDDARNPNRPAVVSDRSADTKTDTPVEITLPAQDPDGDSLTLRVVSQPKHGSAGISGTTARYIPDTDFAGYDAFTFAAWDGSIDSNLATVTIAVARSSVCGNGILEVGEECDDGDTSFNLGDYCAADCTVVPCGIPSDFGTSPTATDALVALRASVGQLTCDVRVCDVNSDEQVTAQDALMILQQAVGLPAVLHCPVAA